MGVGEQDDVAYYRHGGGGYNKRSPGSEALREDGDANCKNGCKGVGRHRE